MKTNDRIPIRNLYYMLSYAYQTLSLNEYKNIELENFQNVTELYAEILLLGLPVLIRGGLAKDYVQVRERKAVIRGKIDLNSSIKQNALVDKKMVVLYDDFSEDILLNQIIKATLIYLSRTNKINPAKRKKLLGLLPYFSNVADVELNLNLWKRVTYDRQSIRYQFAVDICRFLYQELLLGAVGEKTSIEVDEAQELSSLYEKFVFSFYKKETVYRVTRPQIKWKVTDDFSEGLPIMRTDLVLQEGQKTLIIDTKFYSKSMVNRFPGSLAKHHSGNLYQLFAYVNNWLSKPDEKVGGILLYARTIDQQQPNHNYLINGNRMSVVNLDLNQEFEVIKKNLLVLAQQFFQSGNDIKS